eukprot:21538-Heterococcus_DN1.PRE.3
MHTRVHVSSNCSVTFVMAATSGSASYAVAVKLKLWAHTAALWPLQFAATTPIAATTTTADHNV